ncbi:VOC family protein [Microbacterium soli]|uniref:VOC domain-containing protein n=1 Tax=Microbacterium soli TaxID=446075 RepID=A0ABP7MXK4_9MICO
MFEVGGVRMRRPFKIRRVSHVGLNARNMPEMKRCYGDLLGLVQTDVSEGLADRFDPEHRIIPEPGSRGLHFYRYGADHHQFVLMDQRLWEILDPDHTTLRVNQLSWQVGSLEEVRNAIECLGGEKQRITRSGRDMPGSNWHTYVLDPDGYTFELTFGMEQIGWDRLSKPRASWDALRFGEFPDLPHQPENIEMAGQRDAGVDLRAGFEPTPQDGRYDVDGVRLPRPFKIVGLGPLSIVVEDFERSVAHYEQIFGFDLRFRGEWNGVRFAALACNTAHHAMMLYEASVRPVLGLADDAGLVATGFQVANHRQLRAAVGFLTENGLEEIAVPAELVPGFRHVAHLRDPDGNIIQLYFQMRQCITGDGREGSRSVVGPAADWPAVIDPSDDVFQGEVFMGPWA